MAEDLKVHWRDSALTPKFYIFDARAGLALLLLIISWNKWCLYLLISIMTISAIMNYFNLPVIVGIRVVKNVLIGKKRIIFKYE